MVVRWQILIATFLLINWTGGCSRPGRNLEMAPMVGKVTFAGSPLQDGIVSLESAQSGFAASGNLDENGEFRVAKIPVGTYAVAVTPPAPPDPGDVAPPRPSHLGPLRIAPVKYHSQLTSGLEVTVTGSPEDFLAIDIPGK